MEELQDDHVINFKFNGKAGEYFKIWIVNIALSIITLGIYSAWAKVRTKRYFYGNTTFDGSSFEYLANPLTILKGRLIVFGFILAYAVTTQFMPAMEIGFFLIYLVALPWLVIKSMQFNARNSAYRNIRFNFDGTILESAIIFIALTIFTFVTMGLALPYLMKCIKKFLIEHSYFGVSKFDFHATTGAFYKIYLKALLIPFLIAMIGIIAAIAIPAYNSYIEQAQLHSQAENTQVEQPQPAEGDWSTYEEEPSTVPGQQGGTADMQKVDPVAVVIGTIIYIVILALYILIGVYIQTRTANLVLCNTTLENHRLNSTLRVRSMFYLYMTNMLAVIFSAGLLIPWAKIRLARYRFENTSAIVKGDLDSFIANEQVNVKATASEFADAFDIDLGF
jgi:uncharacterized membrane protein YjgN (DUF898 family)